MTVYRFRFTRWGLGFRILGNGVKVVGFRACGLGFRVYKSAYPLEEKGIFQNLGVFTSGAVCNNFQMHI